MIVEVDLQDLTTQGLDRLMQDLSGEPGAWLDKLEPVEAVDRAGADRARYTRKNAVHEILARSSAKFASERWTATINNGGEVTIETGATALQAVAKVFVSAFPKGAGQLEIDVSAETVTTYLKDVGPVIGAALHHPGRPAHPPLPRAGGGRGGRTFSAGAARGLRWTGKSLQLGSWLWRPL